MHLAKIRLVPSRQTQETNHCASLSLRWLLPRGIHPRCCAVKAARQSDLPKPVLKVVHDAPFYAEGTGVRLEVKKPADLGAIRKPALIKLTN